jgi:hypothetical protein
VHADEKAMRFTFVYDPINGADPVTNGQYINARPCEQGGSPGATNNSCGWCVRARKACVCMGGWVGGWVGGRVGGCIHVYACLVCAYAPACVGDGTLVPRLDLDGSDWTWY